MAEQAVTEQAAEQRAERWIAGRNGGRLRPGGPNPGPRKATILVRNSVVEALRDPRGGSGREFWIALKTGSAEDRRTFANVCSRLIPVEVAGTIDASLTVRVVSSAAAYVRPAHTPLEGTCTAGDDASRALTAPRIESESDSEPSA